MKKVGRPKRTIAVRVVSAQLDASYHKWLVSKYGTASAGIQALVAQAYRAEFICCAR